MIRKLQPHLKIDAIEKYVLLPGDPGRIDKISKYLVDFKEINTNREFRSCVGNYKGMQLVVVSTGIGCPAAAIAVEELANAGAKTVIRIGTCGGLLKNMCPGDIVIPTAAACFDGTTKEYDSSKTQIGANKMVFDALTESAKKLGMRYFVGINRTHDAFYEPTENFVKLAGKNLISSEMECSAVFLVSKLRGMRAGAVLVVNTPEPPEEVAKNPNIVYELADEKKVQVGIDNAIKIALDAIKYLNNSTLKDSKVIPND